MLPSDFSPSQPESPTGVVAAPSGAPDAEILVEVSALPDMLREDIEDAPFWKEVVAFANMPQSALDPFFGRYVAIYKGDIVDSDVDEGELALRFYRTFGYVPVYIHKVGVEDNVIDLND